MKKKYFISFIVFLMGFTTKAQLGKEAWHWVLSYGSAIDFSSGVPIADTSCTYFQSEGSACASDPNTGQLLFYTSGFNIWDKNNNEMPNDFGLFAPIDGGYQGVIIIPKPNSTNLFYVIIISQPSNFIYYSIVDMNLHGGLGDVTVKNQLISNIRMKTAITAVKHCNGKDYWIVARSDTGNNFNAFLINNAGISITPVISSIGMNQGYGNGNLLKFSPNGKKLGNIVYDGGGIPTTEVFDFNTHSGQFTNCTSLTFSAANHHKQIRALAFSPDDTKLYLGFYWWFTFSGGNTYSYNKISQFIISNSSTNILASETVLIDSILNVLNMDISHMQLGPDGKIYFGWRGVKELAAINNPNALGINCNLTLNAFSLNRPWGLDGLGLPNFIDANFSSDSSLPVIYNLNKPLCNFTTYNLSTGQGSNYQWSTNSTSQITTINNIGNYWVSYVNADGCKEIDTFFVTLTQPPAINNLQDITSCDNLLPIAVDATYPNTANYLWYDNLSSSTHSFSNSGIYWIDYYLNNNCVARDSFNLSVKHVLLPGSFPNIVTPNDDGINDFIDFGKHDFSSLQLEIYNRWGDLIFESNNTNCIWKPNCSEGTYYLVAHYSMVCGNKTEELISRNFITIIK